MSHAKRVRAVGVKLAFKPMFMIFFFFFFSWVLQDLRRFFHRRKGGFTHYAHMFALRYYWDRHD